MIENKAVGYRYVGVGTFRTTPKIIEYVNDVLLSGNITYGKYSKRFEKEFAGLHGCQYGILSNSGTSSLQVALQALKELHGWNDGTEVIVPATTFIATANIVRHCNMVPVFVDVDTVSYNMSMRDFERKLNANTRAVIPVNMFGLPVNIGDVRDVIGRRSVSIIEDSCETMFATSEGYPVGSTSDVGCFSLYAAHIIVAGVGGIATTNRPALAKKMRSLVNHGLTERQLNMDDNFSPRQSTGRRFIFDSIGHSFRITEFEAAVACAQLEQWQDIIRKRRINAHHLNSRLKPIQTVQIPHCPENATHSYMMYPVLLLPDDFENVPDKAKVTAFLNDHGVQTRDMPTMIRQPAYSEINPADFPVSDYIEQHGFYVGVHQDLDIQDMDFIADAIICALGA